MAWWSSAGKELSSWLSICAVLLHAVLNVCVPFPFGVWGRMWYLIVSVPDQCLFVFSESKLFTGDTSESQLFTGTSDPGSLAKESKQ